MQLAALRPLALLLHGGAGEPPDRRLRQCLRLPLRHPDLAHYLRNAGYRTCLAGKMHFVGADQLHGFEDRVTTDIYPGDFGWTPTWEDPEKIHWWFHNMLSVTEAGPYDRTLEIDYDEEVALHAARWLWDHARGNDERPFMLCVSLMHPHDPYLAPRHLWDLYRDDDIDMPAVPSIPPEQRDPFSRRMWDLYDRGEYEVTDKHIRTARHGYYSMVTYADELIGKVLQPLERQGLADNTVVIVTADHGDMLGERGLWFKMVFFERSVRVPLIMRWPGRLEAAPGEGERLPRSICCRRCVDIARRQAAGACRADRRREPHAACARRADQGLARHRLRRVHGGRARSSPSS